MRFQAIYWAIPPPYTIIEYPACVYRVTSQACVECAITLGCLALVC